MKKVKILKCGLCGKTFEAKVKELEKIYELVKAEVKGDLVIIEYSKLKRG